LIGNYCDSEGRRVHFLPCPGDSQKANEVMA